MHEDRLIACLNALCRRYSQGGDALNGRHEVAKRSGLSEQYLYQVMAGKLMANGNRRSLGKEARGKLSKAFPNWLDLACGGDQDSDQSIATATQKEVALLNLFRGLTEEQRDALLRGAEETKQTNDRIIEELTGKKPAASRG